MDQCSKCEMPLDDETRCSCEPNVCYHCCSCGEGCSCGCSEKEAGESKEEDQD